MSKSAPYNVCFTPRIYRLQAISLWKKNGSIRFYVYAMAKSTNNQTMTTQEVATRFNELAKQEKWFEIQDELFAENVKSIDPTNSPYFGYAEGKANVREKGMNWVNRITAAHHLHTTEPVVAGNHFAVARDVDITVEGFGRIQIKEIMLYEVKEGKITLEQFFY